METKIRIFGINTCSFVDGIGIRYVIFVQGCPHNCKGCHNPYSHSFTDGTLYYIDDIIDDIKLRRNHLDGITFSGGEPFCHQTELIKIAEYARLVGLDVVCYTGYTYEKLVEYGAPLLNYIDTLIDGPYIEELKEIDSTKFRGSTNQIIINVRDILKG